MDGQSLASLEPRFAAVNMKMCVNDLSPSTCERVEGIGTGLHYRP